MVHYLNRDDILALCDGLCTTLQPETPNWPALKNILKTHINGFADTAETHYIPSHKWLEFIAGCVEHAVAIADETQLRPHEANAMLQQMIGPTTPLYKKFMLDAAMERARYEPIMLAPQSELDESKTRISLLTKRWQAMKHAQQSHAPLSDSMLDILDATVMQAVDAPYFANYRIGPMLQFFSEMLQMASRLQRNGEASACLSDYVDSSSNLWRRYRLKSARFETQEESKNLRISPENSLQPPLH
jgi:hypothetical protein